MELLQASPIHGPPHSSKERGFKWVKRRNDSQPPVLQYHKPLCLTSTESKHRVRLKSVSRKGIRSGRAEEGRNPPLPSQSHSQGQQFSLYKTLALFLI